MAERSRKGSRAERPQPGPSRFDATIHPGPGMKDVHGLDAVPLDRMPDRFGRLRVLVTADECANLLDLGYEVRLHRHYPIQPLDARLIATDKSVEQWLEERLAPVRPAETRPPKRATKRATKKR